MAGLFDPTVDVLARSLDMYLLRHSLISENIANAETPFYKARRVDFEGELQKAVDSNSDPDQVSREISSVTPKVYEDPFSETGQDRNTVDMDREMAELSKNDVKYSAATIAISKKLAMLKFAATDGGEK
jgi:flagellar basal-body rod protein FlgB